MTSETAEGMNLRQVKKYDKIFTFCILLSRTLVEGFFTLIIFSKRTKSNFPKRKVFIQGISTFCKLDMSKCASKT